MSNKRVLVIGKNGQLGLSFQKLSSKYTEIDFSFVDRRALDLMDLGLIGRYFELNKFDVIVNCAAYTAVDNAEKEPELAEAINHKAVKCLAKIAKEQDMLLIHISTDYVFNGKNHKPYLESDKTEPINHYGLTKLLGERAMQAENPRGLIIRTSWVYGEYGNNFLKTMLRLGKELDSIGVIYDQIGSPTYSMDLASSVLKIISSSVSYESVLDTQVYHFSNEGTASWYEFAKAIFRLTGVVCKVNPIEAIAYPTPAARPHYSLLNKNKIKQKFGLVIPDWEASLEACLLSMDNEV